MRSNEKQLLSTDFAVRVLRQADRAIARRRAGLRGVAGAAAVSFLLVGIISLSSLSGTPGALRPEPSYVEPLKVPTSSNDQMDPLAYMFPDATSVARFAAEYSDSSNDTGVDSDMLTALDAGTP